MQEKRGKNDTHQNLVLKAKEVWNVKIDTSKMDMRELRTIIMPLQNKDYTGVEDEIFFTGAVEHMEASSISYC